MRKIVLIALAFVTLQATAQEQTRERAQRAKKERVQYLKDLTPQELATLKTKKMTLHLDLTEAQQKKVMALNLANAEKREKTINERRAKREALKGEKPSKEELYKARTERLDHLIEMKAKMRDILNDEQYEKWSKNMTRKLDKTKSKKYHKKHKPKE